MIRVYKPRPSNIDNETIVTLIDSDDYLFFVASPPNGKQYLSCLARNKWIERRIPCNSVLHGIKIANNIINGD